jgi:AP-1 complex subunit mu
LILKYYKNDLPSDFLETFNRKMIEFSEENNPPLFKQDELTFFFQKHTNITILIVGKGEQDAIKMMSFLNSITNLLNEFFNGLDADCVKDNLILIYELLDEVMDNGQPQLTDAKLLKNYVTSSALLSKKLKMKNGKNVGQQMAKAITSSVPWRPGTYKYSKNETYLDVIEKISMLVAPGGNVLKSEVEGTLHMNCKLSGTPELILGLNDKKFFELNQNATSRQKKAVDIQDIKFHQCVRLAKFENDRTISFIPPDGEFDLISYRMQCPFKSLFGISIDYVSETDTQIHFIVKMKTNYKSKVSANFIELMIPLPSDCQGLKTKCSKGKAKHVPDKNVVGWKIGTFAGKKEATMEVKLNLPSLKSNTGNFKTRPVEVIFDISHYTLSGLNVRYLKIKEKSNYNSLSWVRYVARNGNFMMRTHDNTL